MNYVIWPPPGTVIHVCVMGKFRHYGIVSDRWSDGKPMIIANAWLTKGVREISWEQFRDGRQVFQNAPPSALPAYLVVQNARHGIGLPYDVLTFNCEHFVQRCYGNQASSAQVGATLGVVSIAVLSFALVGMLSEA